MAEHTEISWCDHTFNPWIGCTKISDGKRPSACDHCYAETLAKRYGWAKWGVGEPRKMTSPANWRKPLAWDKAAKAEGVRRRVFCASLADVFDAEVSDEWRVSLMELVLSTPNLDWLLLTKRPQVAKKWFDAMPAPRNVWLGTTVEDQKMADLRIPILLSIPGIQKRFLSCEPLLGPVNVKPWLFDWGCGCGYGGHETLDHCPNCGWVGSGPTIETEHGDVPGDCPECSEELSGYYACPECKGTGEDGSNFGPNSAFLDWVIAGGESGPGSRPPMIGWMRSLRDQCATAGVAFHFKQWGEFTPDDPAALHTSMRRVGKKAAGALLDGREHREFPT